MAITQSTSRSDLMKLAKAGERGLKTAEKAKETTQALLGVLSQNVTGAVVGGALGFMTQTAGTEDAQGRRSLKLMGVPGTALVAALLNAAGIFNLGGKQYNHLLTAGGATATGIFFYEAGSRVGAERRSKGKPAVLGAGDGAQQQLADAGVRHHDVGQHGRNFAPAWG